MTFTGATTAAFMFAHFLQIQPVLFWRQEVESWAQTGGANSVCSWNRTLLLFGSVRVSKLEWKSIRTRACCCSTWWRFHSVQQERLPSVSLCSTCWCCAKCPLVDCCCFFCHLLCNTCKEYEILSFFKQKKTLFQQSLRRLNYLDAILG